MQSRKTRREQEEVYITEIESDPRTRQAKSKKWKSREVAERGNEMVYVLETFASTG